MGLGIRDDNENMQDTTGKLRVSVLASGSKGNSIYISNGHTAILLDAGLSRTELIRRLSLRSISPDEIRAILISHEHTDHIRGAGTFSRQFRIPVYMTPKTALRAKQKKVLEKPYAFCPFTIGKSFSIDSLQIRSFSTSHDAEESSGFTIEQDGIKIGIATDLGVATHMVRNHLKECHFLILEANHDTDMLHNGPYPWFLKQRIKGKLGHLSNIDARELLSGVCHKKLKHVVLAHVSEKNNCVHLLNDFFRPFFEKASVSFSIASQEEGTPVFSI